MTYKVVMKNHQVGEDLRVTADDVDVDTCGNDDCRPCPHHFYNFTKEAEDGSVTVAAIPCEQVLYITS